MTEYTQALETQTRKKIDQILKNLDWEIDEEAEKCNVFTERAKTTEQNKKFKGKSPDYVLYKSETDMPLAIIEAKRPSQSMKKALDQAIELYAKPLDVALIFVTDGILFESFDLRTKTNLYLDDQLITNLLSEKMLLKFFEHGAKIYTPEKISHTKRELIEIFSGANELLREEGLREGIERFTEFSNLLFLKLISEIEEDRENSGEPRILEKKYCWDAFCSKPADEMLDYINKIILPRLVNQYNHSGEVFQKELAIKNPKNLKAIVDKLSVLRLLNTDSDVKGDAFEYFLKNSVTVGNDLGEYFTPRHIVKLIVDLVDPKFGEKIYDPCCGTGGFLIEAFRNIKSKCQQTKENINILKEKTVWGRELTATAKIAKMNMIIIGDGHTNIVQMDSLMKPIKEPFDVILTNFPFSQTTNYNQLYGFNSNDANPVFLKHVIDALNADGGRAGVIVPDGLLFDKIEEYIKLRKLLLETCNVLAIVQLDPFVFSPYTKQPTSIIFFEKKPNKKTKTVWFFDVIDDGFKKTGSKKGRPPIDKNDLIELRQLWADKEKSTKAFNVDFETIKNNYYKLNMNAYKKRIKRKVPIKPLGELCDIIIGFTPPTKERTFWGGKNNWVTITDMSKGTIENTEKKITGKATIGKDEKLLPAGTLLFSFKLTIGQMAILKKQAYTNEAIAGLMPKDKKDFDLAKYLYYILPKLDFEPYAQRATKGFTLNKESIADIEIPYPDEPTRTDLIKKLAQNEIEKNRIKEMLKKITNEQDNLITKFIQ